MSRVWSGSSALLRPPPVWKTGALLTELDPDLVPSSGNDPEPPAFQASAQTFYATTAETGASGGDRTQPFRFTKAARRHATAALVRVNGVEPIVGLGPQRSQRCAFASFATLAYSGAEGGSRTHMSLGPRRSERRASAIFATSASGGVRGARTRNLSCAIAALSRLS